MLLGRATEKPWSTFKSASKSELQLIKLMLHVSTENKANSSNRNILMLFYCINIFFFLPLWFVADVEAAATAPFTKTRDIDIAPYSLLTKIDPKSST